MHGLINRSIECFLRDTYGYDAWCEIAGAAGVSGATFETMLRYDDAVTFAVLEAGSRRLTKPIAALLEDLGAYLVTREPLRRLLRFGGIEYHDFLLSLPDLQGRGQMAVPDLDLPHIMIRCNERGRFTLICQATTPGFGQVLTGLLRAMADDYGALALIDDEGRSGCIDTISVALLEARYSAGRRFELARPAIL